MSHSITVGTGVSMPNAHDTTGNAATNAAQITQDAARPAPASEAPPDGSGYVAANGVPIVPKTKIDGKSYVTVGGVEVPMDYAVANKMVVPVTAYDKDNLPERAEEVEKADGKAREANDRAEMDAAADDLTGDDVNALLEVGSDLTAEGGLETHQILLGDIEMVLTDMGVDTDVQMNYLDKAINSGDPAQFDTWAANLTARIGPEAFAELYHYAQQTVLATERNIAATAGLDPATWERYRGENRREVEQAQLAAFRGNLGPLRTVVAKAARRGR